MHVSRDVYGSSTSAVSEDALSVEVCVEVINGTACENVSLTTTTQDGTATANGSVYSR